MMMATLKSRKKIISQNKHEARKKNLIEQLIIGEIWERLNGVGEINERGERLR